jgi:hypothetical protein
VKTYLNIPKNDWVFYSDVSGVKTLDVSNAGIQELYGLCYFKSIEKLYIGGNPKLTGSALLRLGTVNSALAQQTR